MAGARPAGPTCTQTNPVNIDDGTLCRAPSPTPAPTGWNWIQSTVSSAGSSIQNTYHAVGQAVSADYAAAKTKLQGMYQSAGRYVQSDYEGARCLYQAALRATDLAPDAVLEETGYQLRSVLQGLLPGLVQMIVILGVTTFLGAAIGGIVGFFFGGVGAAPGAVVGADIGFDIGMAALTWLGVAFLAVSIAEGFVELLTTLKSGVEIAWAARNLTGKAEEQQVERAAHAFARCVGILVRLILQGILAYLLKKAAVRATRGAMQTARMAQAQGAAAIAEADVAELVGRLRGSRLGAGFADWVDKNWRNLSENPKLKPKPASPTSVGGGGAETQAGEDSATGSKSSSSEAAEEEKPDLSSNAKKGVFGEAKADAWMKERGFKKLNGPDVQVGDAPRGQGIDGVYENPSPPPQYVVAEAKFGSSRLGTTKDGMQMSENWVDNRLEKAVGRETADDIQLEGYDRWLLRVDENGNVTPSAISEDSAGNLSLSNIPAKFK